MTTVSLVLSSESTLMLLKLLLTAFRRHPSRISRGMSRSVSTYASMVAMCGSTIPAPFAKPTTVALVLVPSNGGNLSPRTCVRSQSTRWPIVQQIKDEFLYFDSYGGRFLYFLTFGYLSVVIMLRAASSALRLPDLADSTTVGTARSMAGTGNDQPMTPVEHGNTI